MKIFLLIPYISLTLFATISCKSKELKSAENEVISELSPLVLSVEQFKSAGMVTGPLREYNFNEIVHSNGYIEAPPQNIAKISAVIGGHISYNPLLVGDKVKKGQLIARMENPEYITLQMDFAETAFQLNFAQSEYERQKTLSNENIAAQKVFLKAEADYKSLQIKYEGLKKTLQMLGINTENVLSGEIVSGIGIFSPLDGFVSAQNLVHGMVVSPGDILMEIIDNSHLHLALFVFEGDAMKVRIGQKIRFKVTQSNGTFYDGEVLLVGKSVEGSERKVAIHGHIINENMLDFVTGMYVEAEITVAERKSCGLPNEAVVNGGGKDFIYVLKDIDSEKMFFEKRYVNIGQTGEEITEVLCKNDSCTVLVKGAFNLAEGF